MNKTKSIVKSMMAVVCVAALLTGVICAFAACGDKSSITFAKNELTVYAGEIVTIDYTVNPQDADITWESSNKSVATVSKSGRVTTIAKGTTVITASLESGAKAECALTVLESSVSISEHEKTVHLEDGTTSVTLTATGTGNISWVSSNPSVATVSGGVVTFASATARETTVTITAQCGLAKDACVITVIDERIAEDYYILTKETNANVVANPGVWYYHADGSESNDYRFADDGLPSHSNGVITATLDRFPSLDGSPKKYFRFRYQPDMEIGTKYTLKFTMKVNVGCTIGYGTASAYGGVDSKSIPADAAKSFTYIGTVNDKEPFHININALAAPLEDGYTVSYEISNVTVKEYEPGDEDVEIEIPDTPISDVYNLKYGTKGDTCSDMGVWYYLVQDDKKEDLTEAAYDHGAVTFGLSENLQSQYHQIRIQPRIDIGKRVQATFTVSLDQPAKITFGRNDNSAARTAAVFGDELTEEDIANGVQRYELNTPVTLTKVFVMANNDPFVIAVTPKGHDDKDLSNSSNVATKMVVTDVTFAEKPYQNYTVTFNVNGGDALENNTVTVREEESVSQLPVPTKADSVFVGWYDNENCTGTAIVAPYTPTDSIELFAKWDVVSNIYVVTYETNGGDEIPAVNVAKGENTVLPAPTRSGYVFDGWYADEDFGGDKLNEGDEYTPAADITLYAKWLKEITVRFDTDTFGATVAAKTVTEGSEVTVSALNRAGYDFGGWYDNADFTGEAVAESYVPTADVTLYAKWTAKTEYDLSDGDYGTTTKNRDAWYYRLEGTQANDTTAVTSATYNDGTVSLSVTGVKATESGKNSVMFRFMPDFASGKKFTISFKVTVNVAGKIKIGLDNTTYQSTEIAADTPTSYETTEIVTADGNNFKPYLIRWYNTSGADADVTITVTDIVVAPYVQPSVYRLSNVTNGAVCADPGVWYCNYPGASTAPGVACDTENTKYDNGVITFAFTNIVNADGANGYQLRYQPDLSVGSTFTITFKFKISVAGGRVLYSSEYKNSNDSHGGQPMDADEELEITYTGEVKSAAPFMIQIKGVPDGAVTLTVWDVVVTAA